MGTKISDILIQILTLPDSSRLEISKLLSTMPDVWETEYIDGATIKSEVLGLATLNAVLLNDPETGGEDILISLGDLIKSVSGNAEINFGASGDEINLILYHSGPGTSGLLITDLSTKVYRSGAINTNYIEFTDAGTEINDQVLVVINSPTIQIGSASNLLLDHDATLPMEAVTYQQAVALVTGLYDLRGGYDASSGLFPTTGGSGVAGAILKADTFIITVAGSGVGEVGDEIIALVDTPGQTSSNWAKLSHQLGYTPITNVLNSTQILVGNSSNVATPRTMSGDATLDNVGAITIGADKVTVSMIADVELKAIAGLVSAADQLPYFTGVGTATLYNFTSTKRTALDNLSGVNTGDNSANTNSNSYADGKVSDAAYAASWGAVTGIAPSKNAVYNKIETILFNIPLAQGAVSPADATTYYFGLRGIIGLVTTSTDVSFTFGYSFKIIGAIVSAGSNSISGGSEASSLKLRNVTQATSTFIGTFLTNGSTSTLVTASFSGLNIAVAAGDTIAAEWTTPTWLVNPVGVGLSLILICQRT